MTDQDLLNHLKSIEKRLASLDYRSSVVFGLLCLERQLPLLIRTTTVIPWAKALLPELLEAINELWSNIHSDDLSTIQAILPDPIEFMDKDAGSNEWAVAYHVLNAIVDFISSIQEGDYRYGSYTAARNIDLIDMLIDEMEYKTDIADSLFQSEIHQQKKDLDKLKFAVSTQELRKSSQELDLFAGRWFV